MNDPDDPNNHVPEISPGDDWDDVENASAQDGPALPPRRPESASPAKKNAVQPSGNSRPSRTTADDGETPAPSAKVNETQEEAEAGKPARKPASPAKAKKKKYAGKKAAKPAVEPMAEIASEPTVPSPVEEPEDEPEEVERIGIPEAPTGKRPRVNEIGSRTHQPMSRGAKSIPHVALQPTDESDVEASRKRRRYVSGERGDWGEEKGREPVRWMLYTGLGVIVLVILMVTLGQRSGGGRTRESDVSIYSQLTPLEESAQRETQAGDENGEMIRMLSEGQNQARELYGRFATATSPAELGDILYNSAEVLPVMEDKWEPLDIPAGWKPADDSLWSVMENKEARFGVLDGLRPDFTPFAAYFRNTEEGFKLDWKATSGHGTAGFREMARGTGDGSEIRAWLAPSDFHTFALPEGEFRSYRLSDPRGEVNLWGYTRVGSELDETLINLFTPSDITGEAQREAQVVLRLSPGPDESLPNQWMIIDLIGLSWLDQ